MTFPADAGGSAAATPRRILIVEDEPGVRLSIRTVLRRIGPLEIDEASEGGEALRKLYEGEYHLVFLDMLMPSMNGIEFLQAAQILDPRPEVVIVSAYTDRPEVKAVAHLAAGELRKPFATSDLEQICRDKLGLQDDR